MSNSKIKNDEKSTTKNSHNTLITDSNFFTNHYSRRVIIDGAENNNTTLLIIAGWNIIPVKTNCEISTSSINNLIGDDLVIISEIAGIKVYWPEAGGSTLEKLIPGKA